MLGGKVRKYLRSEYLLDEKRYIATPEIKWIKTSWFGFVLVVWALDSEIQ